MKLTFLLGLLMAVLVTVAADPVNHPTWSSWGSYGNYGHNRGHQRYRIDPYYRRNPYRYYNYNGYAGGR